MKFNGRQTGWKFVIHVCLIFANISWTNSANKETTPHLNRVRLNEQKMNSTRTTPPSLNITRAIREQTRRIARLFFRMFATRLVGPNIWFSPNLTVSNFYTAVVLWKEAIIIFRRSNHFVFDSLDANGLVDIVRFYRLDIESGEWPSWHSKCSHHSS